MKKSLLVLPLLSLVVLVLPARAVTASVTEVGTTSGSAMPGSPTDYIIFNGGNFNSGGTTGVGTAFDLTSFSVSGGVQNYSSGSDFLITPPGGGTPVFSGAINASTPYPNGNSPGGPGPQTAQQMNAGIGIGSNANFNYNDFDVYLMYSNTGGALADSVVSLDAPGQAFGANGVSVTDNTGSPEYLEFNVKNLEASGGTYLVFSGISASSGGTGYIGGVSFESLAVPEPSTYAMMLGGLALLGFCIRRKLA